MEGCCTLYCPPLSLVHSLPELGTEGLTRRRPHPASHSGPGLPEGHGSTVEVHPRHLLVHLVKKREWDQRYNQLKITEREKSGITVSSQHPAILILSSQSINLSVILFSTNASSLTHFFLYPFQSLLHLSKIMTKKSSISQTSQCPKHSFYLKVYAENLFSWLTVHGR